MTDLIAFLHARLDEFEKQLEETECHDFSEAWWAQLRADVAAKRQIIELHGRMSIWPNHPQFNDAHLTTEPMVLCLSCVPETMWRRARSWPCRTLRALALPYAEHPDYREEWKP